MIDSPARQDTAPSRPILLPLSGIVEARNAAERESGASVQTLVRNWAPAIVCGLVVAAATALVAWTVAPGSKYMATATLHFNAAAPRVLVASGGVADFGVYLRTQMALLKSRVVLDGTLSRAGIASLPLFVGVGTPEEWLEKKLTIEAVNGTELINISLQGDRPADLARVVNELTRVYLIAVEKKENRERDERIRKLEEGRAHYTDSRRQRRETVKELSEEIGSLERGSIAIRQGLDLERLAQARHELLSFQSDLRKARVEFGVLEARGQSRPSPISPAPLFVEKSAYDPAVSTHSVRIVELEGRLAAAQRTIRDVADPALGHIRDELRKERRAVTVRRLQAEETTSRRPKGEVDDEGKLRIASAGDRVTLLEEHERILIGEVDRLESETRSLNRTAVGLEEPRGEMDLADDMVHRIASELEALKLERSAPSRVQLLEEAKVPSHRERLSRVGSIGVIALPSCASFALVMMGFAWRESRIGRIDSTETVKRRLGLKLIGVLPRLNTSLLRRLERAGPAREVRRSSSYFEAIDATRAMLIGILGEASTGVLLITSARQAEGKTSLACHLAAGFARAGRSTLLIDGDLRIPAAHRTLQMPISPGLSEVLRGQVALGEAIRPTTQAGLAFLPAGECDAKTLQILARGKVGEILSSLREDYEIVLVDSPPILPVADALLIGLHCDAVLFSILEGTSRVPSVRAALERLSFLNEMVLGAVVAGSPCLSYKYKSYSIK